jgi:hypothetical protein
MHKRTYESLAISGDSMNIDPYLVYIIDGVLLSKYMDDACVCVCLNNMEDIYIY